MLCVCVSKKVCRVIMNFYFCMAMRYVGSRFTAGMSVCVCVCEEERDIINLVGVAVDNFLHFK